MTHCRFDLILRNETEKNTENYHAQNCMRRQRKRDRERERVIEKNAKIKQELHLHSVHNNWAIFHRSVNFLIVCASNNFVCLLFLLKT